MSVTNPQSEILIKAISNEIRRNIIRLLITKNMSYTELAHLLDFDLKRESGKFNFHLKELVNAGLVNNADESYFLTDKGEEMYYLLIDIERDTEVDPHGLLTALIQLEGTQEFSLFVATIGMVIMLQTLIMSLAAFLVDESQLGMTLLGVVFASIGIIGLSWSTWYYIRTINTLLGHKSSASKILSGIFFLNIQWYFIRSKYRLTYLVTTFLVMIGWIMTVMALLLHVSQLTGIEDPGSFVYVLDGIAIFGLLFGTILLKRLYNKTMDSQ